MTLLSQIGRQAIQRLGQFRAKPEAPLLAAIEEAVRAEDVRSGVIISGLGALKKAVFRNLRHFPKQYPVTPDDRLYLEVSQPMELVSLTGWIAPREDGEPEIHAHFAASLVQDESVVTMGGHLTEETICGIKVVGAILVTAPEKVHAEMDPETRTLDLFLG